MRLFFFFLLTYCFISVGLFGQEEKQSREDLRGLWRERLNTLLNQGIINENNQAISLDDLEQFLDNPLDINKVSVEELRQIPFLTDFQVYQFIHYRTNKGGQLLSLADLKSIKSWDRETLLVVLPLLKGADDEDLSQNKQINQEGRSKFNLLYGKRQRAGDEQYLGSPSAFALRYQYHKGEKFRLFLGAEQDYCEPWSYQKHRGFDSYAYSLSAKNFLGLEKVVLGDFRVSWGEGLCLKQGFRLMDYSTSSTYANKLTAVAGLSESNKFRGLAGQWRKGKITLMAFASYRKLDGNIKDDNFIYALSEAGLHRTEKDFERRRQVPLRTAGVQFSLGFRQFNFSLHHLYYDFSKKYTLAHATGASQISDLNAIQQHYNTALSYRWHSRRGDINVSGELARNRLGALAYVQNSSIHFSNLGDFNLRFRSVSPRYWAYYGQTTTHYLRPNNERGLTLAFKSRELIKRTELSTYFDIYKGVKPFDNGKERGGKAFAMSLTYKPIQRFSLQSRFSLKQDLDKPYRLRLGLRAIHQLNQATRLETGIATSRAKGEWAYLLYNKCRYQVSEKIKLNTSILYHNVPNWDGRIYYYEPQLNYQYQSLFLYHKGFRFATTLQVRLGKRWNLASKFAYHRLSHLPKANTEFALLLSYR